MSDSSGQDLYREGVNLNLDKAFAKYQRMRIWSGNGIHKVLNEDELDIIAKLWRKAKLKPRKLTVQDVSKLVEYASCIRDYRAAAEREKCRQRMERSRGKLNEAAKRGDAVAKRKIQKRKKSERKRFAKYYKQKRAKKMKNL